MPIGYTATPFITAALTIVGTLVLAITVALLLRRRHRNTSRTARDLALIVVALLITGLSVPLAAAGWSLGALAASLVEFSSPAVIAAALFCGVVGHVTGIYAAAWVFAKAISADNPNERASPNA